MAQSLRPFGIASGFVFPASILLSLLQPLSAAAVDSSPATPTAVAIGYVGTAKCQPCHETEARLFSGSHHDRAMQLADATTVLGDFKDASFTYNGVTSTFTRRDGSFFVRTDGPDGTLQEYRVAYTFGIDPLQQYLIEFPRGRLQALSVCWDTRPKAMGGQRWFHLYPDEKVDYRDVLHWTGPAQNWNHMCADCHSTDVHKKYDAAADSFQTTWSEIDVSCEACHGPGSRHVQWARDKQAGLTVESADRGLGIDLSPGDATWVFGAPRPSGRGGFVAHLTAPRQNAVEAVCARCHSRRSQIAEPVGVGEPLAQSYLLSLLDADLYHADGQIFDEVFEYGSFLQSRMHELGVLCLDCHDAHSGKPKAEGNKLCTRCHFPAHYDSPAHHHHKAGGEGTSCVQCHMLARNYMVVHRRHDHSFRVPRPDLSATLGTPNTCNDCHRDRSPQWAADAIAGWYGPQRKYGASFAPAIAAGRAFKAGADAQLAALATDPAIRPIVRATAISLLREPARPPAIDAVRKAAGDTDPLLRRAAAVSLGLLEPGASWPIGEALLDDPMRTVRLAAGNSLAGTRPATALTESQKRRYEKVLSEFRAAEAFNADRAESWLNRGSLAVRLGETAEAESDYQRAIRLQPQFLPSYINLADLYRELGRDSEGEMVLRRALALQPDSASLHHVLGLTLVRERKIDAAVAELAKATEIDRENPRYAYVYAIALEGVGRRPEALAVLEDAQRRFTGDRDILLALMQLAAQSGDVAAAQRWANQLHSLDGGAGRQP